MIPMTMRDKTNDSESLEDEEERLKKRKKGRKLMVILNGWWQNDNEESQLKYDVDNDTNEENTMKKMKI